MNAFARPIFALGLDVVLALAETVRRWGNWPFLPFLLDDWSNDPGYTAMDFRRRPLEPHGGDPARVRREPGALGGA